MDGGERCGDRSGDDDDDDDGDAAHTIEFGIDRAQRASQRARPDARGC